LHEDRAFVERLAGEVDRSRGRTGQYEPLCALDARPGQEDLTRGGRAGADDRGGRGEAPDRRRMEDRRRRGDFLSHGAVAGDEGGGPRGALGGGERALVVGGDLVDGGGEPVGELDLGGAAELPLDLHLPTDGDGRGGRGEAQDDRLHDHGRRL